MADSLQDQLRKAGLVNEKKLKKAKRQQHAVEMERKAQGGANTAQQEAQRARAAKAAHDRELNAQRDAAATARAIAAQVKQLIETSRQSRDGGNVAFNFVDGTRVTKILVTPTHQNHLAGGRLAIVRYGTGYELVPRQVADKIAQRDPAAVLFCNDAPAAPAADDPYAKYQIPDDLDW
jgi:uncharacterized protein YaiL (DUF2058 family)